MKHKTLIARFTAREGCAEQVARLLSKLTDDVRREPGNVTFDPYQVADNPNLFVVFEEYVDKEAFQRHLDMPYGEIFNAALGDLIEEEHSQLTFLETLEISGREL